MYYLHSHLNVQIIIVTPNIAAHLFTIMTIFSRLRIYGKGNYFLVRFAILLNHQRIYVRFEK